MALFGAQARAQTQNLVEFRAGKMFMKGKMVHPDTRRGLVYVYQSNDDLMHFCWKDRLTGVVEDDLIIFPDDTEFKHVPQCTTGRVYVLKFKSSSRRFFIWLQEPKTDKDEEYKKKVNDFLNNPPARATQNVELPAQLSGLASAGNDLDIQNIIGNMSQQQLMQLMGGMGMPNMGAMANLLGSRPSSTQSNTSEPVMRAPSSAPVSRATSDMPAGLVTSVNLPTSPPVETPSPARQQLQLSDLSNILNNIRSPVTTDAEGGPNLVEALRTEAIIPILSNAEVQERLLPLLPDGENLPRNEDELRATIHSPQFQQALTTFGSALQSGQLGPLMGQFGLSETAVNAANQGDLETFVRALQSDDTETKDAEMKDVSDNAEKDQSNRK